MHTFISMCIHDINEFNQGLFYDTYQADLSLNDKRIWPKILKQFMNYTSFTCALQMSSDTKVRNKYCHSSINDTKARNIQID